METEEVANTSFWSFIRAFGNHWMALMSGGLITVALGVFERVSGKVVSLWIYACILTVFIFLACYLTWRDAQKEIAQKDALLKSGQKDERRREYIIERLKGFLKEGLEIQSWGGMSLTKIENWGRSSVMHSYNPRVEKFLGEFLGESYVKRFQEKRKEALEEIIKELLD